MTFRKTFNFSIEFIVDVRSYTPARPAPTCGNPSGTAYSDSGDPEEIEFDLYFVIDDKKIPVPNNMYFLYDAVLDDVLDYVEDNI